MRRLAAVAALALVAVLAATATAEAKVRFFRTPSHNIVCVYSSKGGPGPYLRCDVLSLNDVGFTLDRRHRGKRRHVTDSANDPRSKTIPYGTSRRFGPFTCTSRTTGLTCRGRRSGHGFFLSRAAQRVY
jgi:hypothetical protein